MRISRVSDGSAVRFARWVDERTGALWTAASWDGGRESAETIDLSRRAILAPTMPTKIVCVGRNYRAHAAELGNEVPAEPLLFLKPPSALLAHGGRVSWPSASERIDYEGEVAVVIGRSLKRGSEDEARAAIFGLTCADDVTARDLQRRDVQFTRGKGFDTFCPCGPWIETEPPPLEALTLRTRIDGETRQNGSTANMIWGIASLLSFISHVMELVPGDLVLTGTPEGVGQLEAGQRVEVEVDGVATLAHSIGARGEA